MAISIGNNSVGDALNITNNLLSLLDSIINKNYELASENLDKLRALNIDANIIDVISQSIVEKKDDDSKSLKLIK